MTAELLNAFWSSYFVGSDGMYVVHRVSLSLSWLLAKTVTNQPRPSLAAKTSVNAEDTIEKPHSINHPLFTDADEDITNGSTLYPTVPP